MLGHGSQRTLDSIAESWQFEDDIAVKIKEGLRETLKVLTKPVVAVLIVSLLLIVVNLFITQRTYSYNSDDVSWQTTLQTWRPFSGQTAYVGAKDNFLVNVPIMLLFGHFYHMTRTQLLAEAVCFALLNFVLFYIAALYFLKKAGIVPGYAALTPFIWLASFGTSFAVVFLNTNWRDYEFGLSFITYMIAARYYFGEISPYKSTRSKLLALLLFALAVLFTYSDPYYFYFALLPVAGAFAALWILKKVSRQTAYTAIGFAILALASARLFTSVMARVGLFAPQGSLSLTTLHNLHSTLNQLVRAMGNLFNIDFSQDALMALGNLLLLVAVVAFLVYFAVKRTSTAAKKQPKHEMLRLFGLLGIFSIVAYIAIGNAIIGNGRYLVPFVYTGTLVLAIALGSFGPTVRRILLIVLAATTILNITMSVDKLQDPAGLAGAVNHGNYLLIAKLKGMGLTKGYTGYWDSNINTYLSKDTLTVLPVTCDRSNNTTPLKLLVNGSLYSQYASRTFVLIDPSQTVPPLCKPADMMRQFGAPARTVKFGRATIFIYNYDVAIKMPDKP